MTLTIEPGRNLVTVCGENNTGKTNTLRAAALFFNPDEYEAKDDAPYHKFYGSRGQSVYPEIEVDFEDADSGKHYRIKRTFDLKGVKETAGKEIYPAGRKKGDLAQATINKILTGFVVPLVEAANVSLPEIVGSLLGDVYDIQFANQRFRGEKKNLKVALESYRDALLELLNDKLASEIEPLLSGYNSEWSVRFDMDDVTRVRDLITDDIRFVVDDKSGAEIHAKGSGLQRLASLALYFYIARNSKKQVVLLIDEPDSFLHFGLQKKLADTLDDLSDEGIQVFITTHSPVFIDTASLRNVFLLDMSAEEKPYKRKNRNYWALSTECVDITELDGAKQIRAYLGLSEYDYDVLDEYNILVEGQSDRAYLQELLRFFGIRCPRIIPVNGAANFLGYLKFYDSFYTNAGRGENPRVLVLVDNDGEGRQALRNLVGKTFSSLDVLVTHVPRFDGKKTGRGSLNWEIEDFVYPELVCELANRFLSQAGKQPLDAAAVLDNLTKPAFEAGGVVALLEHEKNLTNPTDGATLDLHSTQGKMGISRQLQLSGDKSLGQLVGNCAAQHPEVEAFLRRAIGALLNRQNPLPNTL